MKNKNKAFTLIELLVVIVIIGILATVSVATFGGNKEKAELARNTADCVQEDKCIQARTVCGENGGTNCDSFCEGDTFNCDRSLYTAQGGASAESYPPESEWTAANCFSFSGGTISDYTCGETEIIIPPTIGGIEVENIGPWAFSGNQLEEIYIPDSVTFISYLSFANNNNLTLISIDSNTSFNSSNDSPFGSCSFANSCVVARNIPNGGNVAESCFEFSGGTITDYNRHCNGVDLIIPSVIDDVEVTAIGTNAFKNNALTSVSIPGSVKTIGFGAFSSNELLSVTLPEGIETIGKYAFSGNQIEEVYIPDSVASIGYLSFTNNNLDPGSVSMSSYESINPSNDSPFRSNNCSTSLTSAPGSCVVLR